MSASAGRSSGRRCRHQRHRPLCELECVEQVVDRCSQCGAERPGQPEPAVFLVRQHSAAHGSPVRAHRDHRYSGWPQAQNPGRSLEFATTRRAEQARRPPAARAHPAESEVSRSRRELAGPAVRIHRFSLTDDDPPADAFLINCGKGAGEARRVGQPVNTWIRPGAGQSRTAQQANRDMPDRPRHRSRPSGEWASAGVVSRLRC